MRAETRKMLGRAVRPSGSDLRTRLARTQHTLTNRLQFSTEVSITSSPRESRTEHPGVPLDTLTSTTAMAAVVRLSVAAASPPPACAAL